VVRLLLFPINRRSQGSMARHSEMMARIKPRLAALKEKHKNDSRKYAEEQMKLMKAEGVPLVPLGGCLPLLLQIPIFWGLFSALRTSIALRQASWLWVHDLSQPDYLIRFDTPIWNPLSLCGGCCGTTPAPIDGLHLLPILMTIAWMANSYLMPRPASMDQQAEQQRKMMMFMPVLFGFMMYSYAAGLSLYWLTSSLFGIIETRVIRKYFPLRTAPKPQPATGR
jgi:YidC/Oxa1 family membrane protein insertase